MKVLFSGPTLYGLAHPGKRVAGTDIICREPAQQGDISRAVLDGASVIGLIDGRYEDVAAPWHKEILYALDRGVLVYGAASMGALRAAECAPFGMVPVGVIAARYLDGTLTDDAAVAQIHGPPELGCMPLSEALVVVEATLFCALNAGALDTSDKSTLLNAASSLFFKERTFRSIVEQAGYSGAQAQHLLGVLQAYRKDVKREDAQMLVARMRDASDSLDTSSRSWSFRQPSAWRCAIEAIERDHHGSLA